MKLSETSLLSRKAPVHFHMCFYVRLQKTKRLCNRFVNMLIRMLNFTFTHETSPCTGDQDSLTAREHKFRASGLPGNEILYGGA